MTTLTFDDGLHEYRWGGRRVESVTQILKIVFPNVYAGIPPAILDLKSMLGGAVHKVIEMYLVGNTAWTDIHPKVLPYFESWLAWWGAQDVGKFVSEEQFYYAALDYAGTDDFQGVLNGEDWILDWKITSNMLPTHRLQLAGYAFALNPRARRGALYLQADGSKAVLQEYTALIDITDWLSTVRVYNIGKGLT